MAASLVTFRIAPDPPARLDKALARDVPEEAALSRSRLARLIEAGAVRVNGGTVRDAKARLDEGDEIEITVEAAEPSHIGPEAIPLSVLYEDPHLIVVDKPAGMVVHPAPGTPSGTLVNALLHHCGDSLSGVGGQKRPGIVHRIDKDTSGLLVVAKDDRAHHGLAALFEAHDIDREYRGLCHGVPDANDPRLRGLRGVSFEPGNTMCLRTHLARHKTDRQKQAVCWDGGRHAVTRARVIEDLGAGALIACWLETGRTHQIRVHMAYAGHGLIGDPVYGGNRRMPAAQPGATEARAFARQALHAARLGFAHPVTGAPLEFQADLPPDMADLLASMRGGS